VLHVLKKSRKQGFITKKNNCQLRKKNSAAGIQLYLVLNFQRTLQLHSFNQ